MTPGMPSKDPRMHKWNHQQEEQQERAPPMWRSCHRPVTGQMLYISLFSTGGSSQDVML
jgi:hypothetical protein